MLLASIGRNIKFLYGKSGFLLLYYKLFGDVSVSLCWLGSKGVFVGLASPLNVDKNSRYLSRKGAEITSCTIIT